MFEDLLPGSVVVVEAFDGDTVADGAVLHPEEEAARRAAPSTSGDGSSRPSGPARGTPWRSSACAPQPVLPGERGAPRWPDGLIGSMTHCDGYCAAALARAGELVSLGIDAEPHDRLPEGVLDVTTLPAERTRLRELARSRPSVHWDRLLFSAKESVYKAWFPLTGLGSTSWRPT